MMPAVLQLAAKSMKMSTKEFLKAMEEGKIGAEEFLPVFTKALREMAAPGLEKAFKTMSISWKRMIANGKLMIKALFDSGIGDLFTKIFNMVSDIFVIMAPVLSLMGGFTSTILKGILYPIKLVVAAIHDLMMLTDNWLGDNWDTSLNEIMASIGKVGAFIISIFFNIFKFMGVLLSPIIKLVEWLFGKSAMFKVAHGAAKGVPEMSAMAGKASSAYSGGKDAASGIAKSVANSTALKRYIQVGAGASAASEASKYNTDKVRIELTPEASDVLRQNKRQSTFSSNVRG